MSVGDDFNRYIQEVIFRDQMESYEPIVGPQADLLIESYLAWLEHVERRMNPPLNQFFVSCVRKLSQVFPTLDQSQLALAALMLGWWTCIKVQNGDLIIPDKGVSKEISVWEDQNGL